MLNSEDEHCAETSKFVEDLIKSKGYPLEIHQVTTEDGYINSVYRICKSLKGQPVLIVHGLTSSVAESVLEDRCLGYYLANQNFDIWMANCRGTTFSRGHTQYSHTKDPDEYWNFGIHEMGYYDIASFIDFVLEKTGFDKIIYVGVSQGTVIFNILMSTRTEYNSKVALACLLCPAISFKYAAYFPLKFSFFYGLPLITFMYRVLGYSLHKVPLTELIRKFGLRSDRSWFCKKFYTETMIFLTGHRNNLDKFDVDLMKLARTTPNSASSKQLAHFKQILINDRFAQFDYGRQENVLRYGAEVPPLYDLSNVTAPVALFYSSHDMFYDVKDIDRVSPWFGNCVLKHLVQHDQFSHKDFVYNVNVAELVYTHVLAIINEYVKK